MSEVEKVGPGAYRLDDRQFQIQELETSAASIGRTHVVNGNGETEHTDRKDLGVFGPGWRADFIGGLTGSALEESPTGAITVSNDEADGVRTYEPRGAEFQSAEGWTMRRSGETITEDRKVAAGVLTLGWKKIQFDSQKTAWRVVSVSTAGKTDTVEYDGSGRVEQVKTEEPIEVEEGASPRSGTGVTNLEYYVGPQAACDGLNPFEGRAARVTYTPPEGSSAEKETTCYGYNDEGALTAVRYDIDDEHGTAHYAYDAQGRLVDIESRSNGAWTLQYATKGTRPTATVKDTPKKIGCDAATEWLWRVDGGCVAKKVAHYGWRKPQKYNAGFLPVYGIKYDNCTSSPDAPLGFPFHNACKMHDYGYGLIGNTYKNKEEYGYLPRHKKDNVDNLFFTTLNATCLPYAWPTREVCVATAGIYRGGVIIGRPKKGADATPDED
ncbi:phospholipase A2 [Amycolatopsis lurida]